MAGAISVILFILERRKGDEMIKKIFLVLPHVIIVQALFLSVMWALDQLNPRMEFLGNAISETVLAAFLVLALINGIWNVWNQCR